jgi:hypothetical protein
MDKVHKPITTQNSIKFIFMPVIFSSTFSVKIIVCTSFLYHRYPRPCFYFLLYLLSVCHHVVPLLLESFGIYYVRNMMALRALPDSRPAVTKALNDD